MPKKIQPPRVVLSDEDMRALTFIWKWKVSTTSAVCKKCYPGKTARRGYERLLAMQKGGLIESRIDARARKYIWQLSKKGFLTIRSELPDLGEEGYKSAACGHDLLSAAVMMGDWLLTPRAGVQLISEQQLSRYHTPPVLVEQPYRGSHKTDGYWYYPAKSKLIALEVQLNSQRAEVYEHMCDFYRLKENSHIDWVIWLTPKKSIQKSVRRYLERYEVKDNHQFISFDNFLKYGWQAPIDAGSLQGETLSTLLHSLLKDKTPAEQTSSHLDLLDVRKSPHMAKSKLYYKPLDNWI